MRKRSTTRPQSRPALDAATGALRLDGCNTALAPDLTRAAFLASPHAARASDLVVNEPWHSWELPGSHIDGQAFVVGVFYEGERLDMIQLFLQDPRYGTSWEDTTEEMVKAHHAAQSRWLRDQLGSAGRHSGTERKFPWGEAGVYYDHHNMESSIVISYRES